MGSGVTVYYSTIFGAFHEQVEQLTDLFRTQYEIRMAYHAILQEKSRSDTPAMAGELEAMEPALEAERTRVAQMQVRQARETAKLMHKALRNQGTE